MSRHFWVIGLAAGLLVSCGLRDSTSSASVHNGSNATAAPIRWVRYTDSAEGAFSLEVPVGWQVTGGLWRFGYFDARWMMTVRSLDGAMIVRLGDVSVPPYALPGPSTGSQGQPYSKPQQFQMMVSAYRTAAEYVRLYGAHRFKGVCSILAAQPGSGWKPKLPSSFAAVNAVRFSQASIAYSCQSNAGLRTADVYARTVEYPASYGTGFWIVDPLISVLASPKDAPTAYAVAQHMLETWRKNPKWVAYQNRLTQVGLSQIMANYQQFLRDMQAYDQARRAAMDQQVAGFESRMAAQQAQVSDFGETLTGIQDAADPLTGEKLQVWTGPHSNYYRNGNGVIINSAISPGPGFHQVNTP
jgi:hypothetical protein